MPTPRHPFLAWFLLAVSASAGLAFADPAAPPSRPFLSPIFGDHMVLQQGRTNRFWGWSQPEQAVSVEIAGRTASAVAGTDGRWQVDVAVPPAGGPYAVAIAGARRIELHDVLVGEVWICGGQSNMLFPLRESARGAAAVKTADQPGLRLYAVAQKVAYAPAAVPQGQWQACTPATAADFSAVAYFFGRRLQSALRVPVGLIEDCVGGSPAESWMSAEALNRLGLFGPQLAEIRRLEAEPGPRYGSFLMHWLDEYDPGAKGATWASPGLDDSAWRPVLLPGGFAQPGLPNVCWFRREVTLPPGAPSGPARIFLGEVEKMDTTTINGRWIGASSWVENPRVYPVPAGVLHPGRNLVAVRVLQTKRSGGFMSPAATLRLQLADGTSIPLAGTWKGKLSVDARPPHPLPLDWENYPTMPSVLYNGMIAPVAPLALAGAIWYQGEANTTHPAQYRRLLPALIADWRSLFQQPALPFIIVSLPAFSLRRAEPGSDGWAELREAQADTVRTVPHTGLAITIDTGEADNIHPKEKEVVGERLARVALALHYHITVAYSGPTFLSLEPLPGALRLNFGHVDGGLVVHGSRLGEFSVAGADRRWHWADARIEGSSVLVSSPEVPSPVAARYAWQANPLATLFNAAGLPAAPFRTDDWPLDSGD